MALASSAVPRSSAAAPTMLPPRRPITSSARSMFVMKSLARPWSRESSWHIGRPRRTLPGSRDGGIAGLAAGGLRPAEPGGYDTALMTVADRPASFVYRRRHLLGIEGLTAGEIVGL